MNISMSRVVFGRAGDPRLLLGQQLWLSSSCLCQAVCAPHPPRFCLLLSGSSGHLPCISYVALYFHIASFFFCLKDFCFSVGPLVINSFSVCMSEKVFILSSLIRNIFCWVDIYRLTGINLQIDTFFQCFNDVCLLSTGIISDENLPSLFLFA